MKKHAKSAEPQTRSPKPDLPVGLLDFFVPLHRRFEAARREILAARALALAEARAGRMPGYLPESEATRDAWKIQVPSWARDQRNQITGPADNAKILVGMCNAEDPGCMPDGEDSITTDWEHVRAAQDNTVAAIRGTLAH